MTNGVDFPCIPFDDVFNADPIKLWQNDGTGVMTEVGADVGFTDTRSGKAFFTFDYDEDGDLDVFIGNNAEHPVLYRNDGGNANGWLRINLRGAQTNAQGVGARLSLQAVPNGASQLREVGINANYMSHDQITAHFGVGEGVSQIHALTVTWPLSGIVQEFSNIPSNRTVLIEEATLGDLNDDEVVDLADYDAFLDCITGPGGGPLLDDCWRVDFDLDGDVDFGDFSGLQRIVTVPAP
jgi:hypothetical protein